MMSRDVSKSRSTKDSNNGKLLNEIKSINKGLYVDQNITKSSSSLTRNKSTSIDKANAPNLKSKHVSEDLATKDKKSFWNWKPLKALSQVRHRRFNCCFTLEVHTIEGLPSKFNGLGLSVHWKRRDGEVVTSPIKVNNGTAEFEEKLTHTCSVYGSRNGPHHSAKYEAKHFLLYAALRGDPKLDLGKHRVDLTRLLPLTLEELENEQSSGTWTTSFKLSGEGKGALMNVSFGYVVLGDGIAPNNKTVLQLLDSKATTRSFLKSNQGDANGSIRRAGSLPANHKPSMTSRSVDDIKILHEVPPTKMTEFSNSVNILYQKFDEEKANASAEVKHEIQVSADDHEVVKYNVCSSSDPPEGHFANECEDADISSADKGLDLKEKTELDVQQGIEVPGDDPEPESIKHLDCSPSGPSEGHTAKECEDAEFSFAEKGLDSEEKAEIEENGLNIIVEQDEKSPEHKVVHDGGEQDELSPEYNVVNDDCEQDEKSPRHSVVHDDAGDTFREEDNGTRNEVVIHDCSFEVKAICTKESLLGDLESVSSHVAELEKEGVDTPDVRSESSDQENQNRDNPREMMPSHSFDDLADSVADEFLNMLEVEESSVAFDSDVEPDSPRERLLREFQREAEASGCSLFGFDIDEYDVEDYDDYAPTISGWEEFSGYSDSLPADQLEYPKIRAKVMEDLETQALMDEWGLDETAFECSPPHSIGGFGSPIDLPLEVPSLPPLGEGLGPFIQTKTGGFMRSMNPVLFSNAKSGGSLIMQVSSPVVVPAELGSGVMDVLKHLASSGLEKLSVQANKLMPLEDITGKTIQQMAWEAVPQLEASKRQNLLQNEQVVEQKTTGGKKKIKGASSSRKSKKSSSSTVPDEVDSEYVSLEDLAPLAMDKIEALSIEGLRIQSGMSDEEAPSNISAQSDGEFSAIKGNRVSSSISMGLEGAAGLQLLNLEDSSTDGNDGDGLMGLSLTLDEWMRLDSGEIDEDQPSERTSKLLAAHHANSTDLNFLRGKKGKASGRRSGLLGNNFTVALMVQLRDPLRDYEPVGTPMLALIQVERIFVPPKPRIYCAVAAARDCNDEDDDLESVPKEESNPEPKEENTLEQDLIPQFKVSEVHVAGLKAEPGKKKLWGNAAQQQSGSRWLLANGMGKGKKNPFMKPKIISKSPLPASIPSEPGDTLWSISARYNGSGAKWKELAALNPHIRNPNVVLSNQTIKLR